MKLSAPRSSSGSPASPVRELLRQGIDIRASSGLSGHHRDPFQDERLLAYAECRAIGWQYARAQTIACCGRYSDLRSPVPIRARPTAPSSGIGRALSGALGGFRKEDPACCPLLFGSDRKIFYGWYIVAAGIVINMLMGGLIMHAFHFYVAELKAEFLWPATICSGSGVHDHQDRIRRAGSDFRAG